MFLIKQTSDFPKSDRPVILAMGCFDGVHIGHQKVISTAVEQAAALGGEAWVYTFNPHPAKVLVPEKAPPLISAPPCRLRQFELLGVHGVIEILFDRAFAQIEPDAFLSNLWKTIPALSGIVCGFDWSFGRRAAGNFQTLETFCHEHQLTATAIHPVLYHGEKASSTHIRKAIQAGQIPRAEQMLGRPFNLFGTVVHGNQVGRKLGFPTANLDPMNELLPGPGVYAAYTRLQTSDISDQQSAPDPTSDLRSPIASHPSAVFIGKRETFGCHKHVIESYLLDFDGDLYGQILEIQLVEKVRDVQPFPSKEELVEQIKKDVAQIREMLTGKN
jgi:riboflavin kinase/FMN adenylyltransferase